MNKLKQLLVSRFWDRTHAAGEYSTWPQEPVVRHCLNRRVTGSPDEWPVDWFAREIVRRPFPRALSLGCGEGALERDLMSKGLCETMLGLDISDKSLQLARRRAAEAGYETLKYQHADLDRLQLEPQSYDAVFAHMALHHVRDLETCLGQVAAALTEGGVLYADEYVGPSRHEWNKDLLQAAEEIYQQLPKAVRRRRRLQLPVDWRDPSEAVRSAEILPLIADLFEIRQRRDYGGNLLSLIYPHLRFDHLDPAARDDLLADLLDRENDLLAAGAASFYTILVATPVSV